LQDGTIGDDLVVKPLSAETRRIFADGSFNGGKDTIAPTEEKNDNEGSGRSLLARYLADNDVGTKRYTNENDDYAFLDEDEDLADDVVMVDEIQSPSTPVDRRWKRNADKEANEEEKEEQEEYEFRSDLHVIFRRKDAHVNHESDYRKCYLPQHLNIRFLTILMYVLCIQEYIFRNIEIYYYLCRFYGVRSGSFAPSSRSRRR